MHRIIAKLAVVSIVLVYDLDQLARKQSLLIVQFACSQINLINLIN